MTLRLYLQLADSLQFVFLYLGDRNVLSETVLAPDKLNVS